jgi:hypothetical protein
VHAPASCGLRHRIEVCFYFGHIHVILLGLRGGSAHVLFLLFFFSFSPLLIVLLRAAALALFAAGRRLLRLQKGEKGSLEGG